MTCLTMLKGAMFMKKIFTCLIALLMVFGFFITACDAKAKTLTIYSSTTDRTSSSKSGTITVTANKKTIKASKKTTKSNRLILTYQAKKQSVTIDAKDGYYIAQLYLNNKDVLKKSTTVSKYYDKKTGKASDGYVLKQRRFEESVDENGHPITKVTLTDPNGNSTSFIYQGSADEASDWEDAKFEIEAESYYTNHIYAPKTCVLNLGSSSSVVKVVYKKVTSKNKRGKISISKKGKGTIKVATSKSGKRTITCKPSKNYRLRKMIVDGKCVKLKKNVYTLAASDYDFHNVTAYFVRK